MASRENPVSPVATTRPYLTISAASINSEPVELQSTPISPEQLRRRGSKSAEGAMSDLSPEDRKMREDLMRERKSDPAVLVDIPSGPGADQLEQAASAATHRIDSEATNNTSAR